LDFLSQLLINVTPPSQQDRMAFHVRSGNRFNAWLQVEADKRKTDPTLPSPKIEDYRALTENEKDKYLAKKKKLDNEDGRPGIRAKKVNF
jgi:hypothetical protein